MLSDSPFDRLVANRPRPLDGGIPPQDKNLPRALLDATRGRLDFHNQFVNVDTAPRIIQTSRVRDYLLIQNQGINSVWIGFDFQPAIGLGILIPANGFYELDTKIGQNDIWAVSSVLNASLFLTWGD